MQLISKKRKRCICSVATTSSVRVLVGGGILEKKGPTMTGLGVRVASTVKKITVPYAMFYCAGKHLILKRILPERRWHLPKQPL
jgi:hypothetical protein